MTYPTKAICPILLEDMRKIAVEKKGETNFFTAQMIKACMKKVIAVNVHQTIRVDEDLEIKAYYAGHVRKPFIAHGNFNAGFGCGYVLREGRRPVCCVHRRL